MSAFGRGGDAAVAVAVADGAGAATIAFAVAGGDEVPPWCVRAGCRSVPR